MNGDSVTVTATGYEYRFVEFRHQAGQLGGVVIRYGNHAQIGGFSEEFAPGAFGQPEDVILNLQHQRAKPVARMGAGLMLQDSPQDLRAHVDLPDTVHGREARELVDANILRGFSVEFSVAKETWTGDHRCVQEATLHGIALVDRPAYSDSQIAARWRDDAHRRLASGAPNVRYTIYV